MTRTRRFASAALLAAALSCLGIRPARLDAGARLQDGAGAFADRDAAAPAAPATREAAPGADEARRPGGGDGGGGDDWFRAPPRDAAAGGPRDFPGALVQDAVAANTRAAAARAAYRRAESDLSAAVRRAEDSFTSSAEFRDALAAEQTAHDAYLAARREALRQVTSDAKYQAMQSLRESISEQIADRREALAAAAPPAPARGNLRLVSDAERAGAEQESLVAMATLKMRVGSDARAMERDALEGSEQVREARRNLAAASARVAELRAQFDETVRESPEIAQARDAVEDARVARLAAETQLKGASLAAREALDFAYRLHRYDRYRYLYDNSYYDDYYYPRAYRYAPGYGYGYGSRPHRPSPRPFHNARHLGNSGYHPGNVGYHPPNVGHHPRYHNSPMR